MDLQIALWLALKIVVAGFAIFGFIMAVAWLVSLGLDRGGGSYD
jgi:hypothetical protein